MPPLLNPRPARNHDPLSATGRVGRNLSVAIGMAVVLIAMVLGPLAFYKVIFVGVVVLAVCGALREPAMVSARRHIRLSLAPLWLGILGISVCAREMGAEAAFGAYVATVGACALWSSVDQVEAEVGTVLEQAGHDIPRTEAHSEVRRSRSNAVAASVPAATHLLFLAGFAVLLLVQEYGVGKAMMLTALAVTNDTDEWMAGIIFDRHPLAPSVSPKKSWEGLMGSLIVAVAAGAGCVWAISGPWWIGAALGVCTVIVSTLGDLGEPLLKRDLGPRDMGTFLSRYGGITDRLDSILAAAPLVYVFTPLVKQERMPYSPPPTSPALPSPGTRGVRA